MFKKELCLICFPDWVAPITLPYKYKCHLEDGTLFACGKNQECKLSNRVEHFDRWVLKIMIESGNTCWKKQSILKIDIGLKTFNKFSDYLNRPVKIFDDHGRDESVPIILSNYFNKNMIESFNYEI